MNKSRSRETARSLQLVFTCALAALALLGGLSLARGESSERGHARWVASWSAAPMADGTTLSAASRAFDDQTVRQIVQISAGGSHVRVELSNEYGVVPLVVGAAHVAVQAAGSSIVAESDRTLTFDGNPSVVIAPGDSVRSDAVRLRVASQSNLAISIYAPEPTGTATFHAFGNQTAYVSAAGDFTGAIEFPSAETSTSRYWLTYVEVLPPRRIGALVALGDSITDGGESTLDANRRWTDFLSRRINPPQARPRLAVLNQGIGCGRLLRDFCGPSAVSRFERDVLDTTGVTAVVLASGFVDIFFATAAGNPAEITSAEEIIAGLSALAREARQQGLAVYGATYTPNEDTTFGNVFTPENEAKRQAVNAWIRTTSELDAVFDFDAAVRDPERPTRLLPEYASADRLHLSDAGYEALANAVDLAVLR